MLMFKAEDAPAAGYISIDVADDDLGNWQAAIDRVVSRAFPHANVRVYTGGETGVVRIAADSSVFWAVRLLIEYEYANRALSARWSERRNEVYRAMRQELELVPEPSELDVPDFSRQSEWLRIRQDVEYAWGLVLDEMLDAQRAEQAALDLNYKRLTESR